MDPVTASLDEVRRRLGAIDDGEPANYIPELALADRDAFGLALVSMAGRTYQAGEADVAFSIQSVSKPFVYALAVTDLGPVEVRRRIGVEPSGEAFNAISLEPGTGRPANAMVNAGAIVATSLVPGHDANERFARIRSFLSAFAGHPLEVDEDVFASESATGDRNRALAYLMRSAGSLTGSADEHVLTYFRQCSLRVSTVDLAVMAATLAGGGVNPVTGERVVTESVAVQTLALMASCGMYDAAGSWLLDVGLPAKSGVSGGLIAASPARFGVAVYSPPLDVVGNPVRGVVALTELSERFALHLMHPTGRLTPTVTGTTTAREVHSTRPRTRAERALLAEGGDRIVVITAQGDLEFTETEELLHTIRQVAPPPPAWVVLDLTRVTYIAPGSAAMLRAALSALTDAGLHIAVAAQEPLQHPLEERTFASGDTALAWCEDRFLEGIESH